MKNWYRATVEAFRKWTLDHTTNAELKHRARLDDIGRECVESAQAGHTATWIFTNPSDDIPRIISALRQAGYAARRGYDSAYIVVAWEV